MTAPSMPIESLLLSNGGISLVLAWTGNEVPEVVHWGAAISAHAAKEIAGTALQGIFLSSPLERRRFSILPMESESWTGLPGLEGHVASMATAPRFRMTSHSAANSAVEFELGDATHGLTVLASIAVTIEGIVDVSYRITYAGSPAQVGSYDVRALRCVLPVPERASQIVDFTGRWARERTKQQTPLTNGVHLRQSRRGRPGHDSAFLTIAATPDLRFRSGEGWAVHLAWSGDQETYVEKMPEQAGSHASALGAAELLRAGEVRLAPGESYSTPHALFVWTDRGFDRLGERFHAMLRRGHGAPRRPRPVTMNSWEAIYFDQSPESLGDLAHEAAALGVERFVIDDGWFRGRHNDHAGLGDWFVDSGKWPRGLGEFADGVRAMGMEFGLWIEPEMVNLDSDLAREHPDWLLAPADHLPVSFRHQFALNLAHPDAFDYLLHRTIELVESVGIAYLKWDHNRDLYEAISRVPGNAETPGVRTQVLALYALLDRVRERFPDLEIEGCAGGGGRVDAGMLGRVQRVWASDTIDPIERREIQRWTQLVVPPEMLGTHIGAVPAHTTNRVTDLSLRMAIALLGHAGIELDLRELTEAEKRALADWITLHKSLRSFVLTGAVVRADLDDAELMLDGIVSADRAAAVFVWSRGGTSVAETPGRIRIPGLDATRSYRVQPVRLGSWPSSQSLAQPQWYELAKETPLMVSGEMLQASGLPMPLLDPAQAAVIRFSAFDPHDSIANAAGFEISEGATWTK